MTEKQAKDALADVLSAERHAVGHGAYDHQPDGATFAEAAAGFLHHVENVKGRETSTLREYRGSLRTHLLLEVSSDASGQCAPPGSRSLRRA